VQLCHFINNSRLTKRSEGIITMQTAKAAMRCRYRALNCSSAWHEVCFCSHATCLWVSCCARTSFTVSSDAFWVFLSPLGCCSCRSFRYQQKLDQVCGQSTLLWLFFCASLPTTYYLYCTVLTRRTSICQRKQLQQRGDAQILRFLPNDKDQTEAKSKDQPVSHYQCVGCTGW